MFASTNFGPRRKFPIGSGAPCKGLIQLPLWRTTDLIYPSAKREGQSRAEEMTIRGRLPYWAVLAILFVTGIAAIIIPAWNEWRWDHGVTTEIGIALLISSVLGATIDRWMKSEIASDVFRAAIGYVLPEEFHSEIQKIISFKFMCEAHDMWYDIHRLDEDEGSVFVRVRTERRLRNITNEPQPQRASVHIDEWGFKQPSEIRRCEILDNGGNVLKKMTTIDKRPDFSLKAETEEVTVAPGQTITQVVEFAEVRRGNDHMVNVFLSPTKNPRVHVNTTKFDYTVDFGVLSPQTSKSAVSPLHTLNGVYFPPSNIRVRWWPKGQ